MGKKKVSLLIGKSQNFLRNYWYSGTILHFSRIYSLTIIISDALYESSIKLLSNIENIKVVTYTDSCIDRKSHWILFENLLWKSRFLSPSFILRLQRFYGGCKPSLCLTEGDKLTSAEIVKIFDSNIPKCDSFIRAILSTNPDILLIPNQAYEAEASEILRSLEVKAKCNILVCIDNWDNLSSKTVFPWKPEQLTVLGDQQIKHAVQIQGMSREACYAIGTPRFDIYNEKIINSMRTDIDSNYILFLGSAPFFNEVEAIRRISIHIRHNYPDLKIMYKPHPARQHYLDNDRANLELLDNVLLYKQKTSDFGVSKPTSDSIDQFPPLSGYRDLLRKARAIISGPTTMLLEASLCRKKVLLLGYDDNNLTSPGRMLTQYLHFENIERLSNVTICWEIETLGNHLNKLLASGSFEEKIPDSLDYFVHTDSSPWSSRLEKLVEKIF